MKKFLKPGRIVILLSGKYAGKKAVILKINYEGSKDKHFGHCLVAGISRYPRKVHKRQSEKVIARRTAIKPFVKYVNFNHFMPTRYLLSEQLDIKGLIKTFEAQSSLKKENEGAEKTTDPLANEDFKKEYKKKVRGLLEDKFKGIDLNNNSEENFELRFLFKPLRF